jgi:hypothetical protein
MQWASLSVFPALDSFQVLSRKTSRRYMERTVQQVSFESIWRIHVTQLKFFSQAATLIKSGLGPQVKPIYLDQTRVKGTLKCWSQCHFLILREQIWFDLSLGLTLWHQTKCPLLRTPRQSYIRSYHEQCAVTNNIMQIVTTLVLWLQLALSIDCSPRFPAIFPIPKSWDRKTGLGKQPLVLNRINWTD